jgi:hypothetical protein
MRAHTAILRHVYHKMADKGGVKVMNRRNGPSGEKKSFKDKEKPTEVRASNITAAKGS